MQPFVAVSHTGGNTCNDSYNLQGNKLNLLGRQLAGKYCLYLVFRKSEFLIFDKTDEHRDFSFRCTYHVVGMFRSTALNRVKLLTVDHKDILELKVVAFVSVAGNDDVV